MTRGKSTCSVQNHHRSNYIVHVSKNIIFSPPIFSIHVAGGCICGCGTCKYKGPAVCDRTSTQKARKDSCPLLKGSGKTYLPGWCSFRFHPPPFMFSCIFYNGWKMEIKTMFIFWDLHNGPPGPFSKQRKAVQHRLRCLGDLFLSQETFPGMNNAQAALETNLAWLSLRSQPQKLTLKPSRTVHVNRAEPTTGTSSSTAPRPAPPISPEAALLHHQTPGTENSPKAALLWTLC